MIFMFQISTNTISMVKMDGENFCREMDGEIFSNVLAQVVTILLHFVGSPNVRAHMRDYL